jgi:protein TonB
MPVLGATVLVVGLVALGTVYWVHRARASNNPVKAAETAAVTPSNPASTGNAQPAISTDAVPAASAAGVKPQADKQAKPKDQAKDQNAAAKPPEPAPQPATQPVSAVDAALRLPQPVPKSNAPAANKEIAKEEPPPPNGAAGVAGSVPGGMPASSVINVVKDLSAAEPKMATQKVSVSSGVAQGMLVHRVAPQYPAQAKQARLQGTVVLQAVIGKDGSVTSVHALRGNPVLTQAAIDAVKQWRYKPYALNGEPVEADTQISVTFSPDH